MHSSIRREDDPAREDLYDIGVTATVLQLLKLPDGTVRVLVEGKLRAQLESVGPKDGYLVADVTMLEGVEGEEELASTGHEIAALMRSVIDQFENYAKLNRKLPAETAVQLGEIEDASRLADAVAGNIAIKVADKQSLLVERDPAKRLEMVFAFMEGELGVLQVEKKIKSRVKRQMEKTQREYYLNEQLKAIQRELGNEDDEGEADEVAELTQKIATLKLSKEARTKATAELKKLKTMAPMSGRGDRRAQLPRRAARPAVGQEVEDQEGHRRRAGGAGRGSLCAGKGEGPDRRISRRCRRAPTS